MTDCVKPSPGKFKSHSANVASSALIDDKTNEIFCVSLPSPNLSSTCKLFIYDIYLSWQFLASVRQSCSPLAFPSSRIFHCVTPYKQEGGKSALFHLENISPPKVMKGFQKCVCWHVTVTSQSEICTQASKQVFYVQHTTFVLLFWTIFGKLLTWWHATHFEVYIWRYMKQWPSFTVWSRHRRLCMTDV